MSKVNCERNSRWRIFWGEWWLLDLDETCVKSLWSVSKIWNFRPSKQWWKCLIVTLITNNESLLVQYLAFAGWRCLELKRNGLSNFVHCCGATLFVTFEASTAKQYGGYGEECASNVAWGKAVLTTWRVDRAVSFKTNFEQMLRYLRMATRQIASLMQ